jgi:CheY-like chemotaxis protein
VSGEAETKKTKAPDSTTRIIQAVAWPIVVLVIVLLVGFNKVAPKELELTPKSLKISFFLLQAAERGGPDGATPPSSPPNLKNIQEAAREASALSLQGAKILWVDDNPEYQSYERNALEQLGVQFTLAQSTSEAIPLIQQQTFQLVITDFARKDDPNAGYTLLSELKRLQPSIPLIIYSSSANPNYIADAKQKGAFTETNQPQVLFNEAINALKKDAVR